MTKLIITRESILDGSIRRLAEVADDDLQLMTDQERTKIVDRMLLHWSFDDAIWIFGYGSLIWNPAIDFTESKIGKIYGYHRKFCLWSTIGRGSPQIPGLLLGLEKGGCCKGVLYRICATRVRTELDILFRRELINASYIPTWVTAHTLGCKPVRAITFVMDRKHPRYAQSLSLDTVIETIATASGTLGTCSEYLLETTRCLDKLGIPDSYLNSLLHRIKSHQDK